MMEMAIVSFNRVRLQYFIAKQNHKALWLSQLLQRPTYLFGTTLIGVNFFLQFGSESARLFYISLGINPDFAMLSQTLLVVLFAELTPMFAARGHSEHVTMLGITPIYLFSKILFPFVWVLDHLCRLIDWMFRSPPTSHQHLTRDELQRAIEGKDDHLFAPDAEELDRLVQNVFNLKSKSPVELMFPLHKVKMLPYDMKAKEVKALLSQTYYPFLPLYYANKENIVGLMYTRDLLRLPDDAEIREIARSPWFITEHNSILQIIKQFRWNNEHLAIVLNEEGKATGILTLDALTRLLFEKRESDAPVWTNAKVVVNCAFSADTPITQVNQRLHISLPTSGVETLEELMSEYLGRGVHQKESVRIGHFRLTFEEVPLLADKKIRVESL